MKDCWLASVCSCYQLVLNPKRTRCQGLQEACKESAQRFVTHLSGWFGRVVCDEGHAAKTIRTRVHQSVARLEAEHVWFLTATSTHGTRSVPAITSSRITTPK
ncbi:hypothetical protein IFM47457_03564 [Aspergillus lentulus]|nr:hypothetical protein IFM47457_03564 [Aspergillus lentulus]